MILTERPRAVRPRRARRRPLMRDAMLLNQNLTYSSCVRGVLARPISSAGLDRPARAAAWNQQWGVRPSRTARHLADVASRRAAAPGSPSTSGRALPGPHHRSRPVAARSSLGVGFHVRTGGAPGWPRLRAAASAAPALRLAAQARGQRGGQLPLGEPPAPVALRDAACSRAPRCQVEHVLGGHVASAAGCSVDQDQCGLEGISWSLLVPGASSRWPLGVGCWCTSCSTWLGLLPRPPPKPRGAMPGSQVACATPTAASAEVFGDELQRTRARGVEDGPRQAPAAEPRGRCALSRAPTSRRRSRESGRGADTWTVSVLDPPAIPARRREPGCPNRAQRVGGSAASAAQRSARADVTVPDQPDAAPRAVALRSAVHSRLEAHLGRRSADQNACAARERRRARRAGLGGPRPGGQC